MSRISVRYTRVQRLHDVGGAREPAESRVRRGETAMQPGAPNSSDADWFRSDVMTFREGMRWKYHRIVIASSCCMRSAAVRAMKERKERDTQKALHVLHQCEHI